MHIESMNKSAWLGFIVAVLLGLTLRILLYQAYSPWISGDTGGYTSVSQNMIERHWGAIDGGRTPGYPAFLTSIRLLAGAPYGDMDHLPFELIVLAQMALGLLVIAATFFLCLLLQTSWKVATLTSAFVGTAVNVANFDTAILTETLSLFLVTTSVAWITWCAFRKTWSPKEMIALGLWISFATLTRPNNIGLFIVLLLGMIFFSHESPLKARLRFAKSVLAWVVPSCAVIVAWCQLNKVNNGHFTMSVLSGFLSSTKIGNYIELAPDEYAWIRDPYVQYRDRDYRNGEGNFGETMWAALPELHAKLPEIIGREAYDRLPVQQRFPLISKKVGELTKYMILHHPLKFLDNYTHSWLRYWKTHLILATAAATDPHPPGTTYGSVVKDGKSLDHLVRLYALQSPIAAGGCFIFPFLAVYLIVRHRRSLILLPVGAVLLNSLISSAFAFVDARNGHPYLPLVYVVSFVVCAEIWPFLKRLLSVRTVRANLAHLES